TLLQGPLRCCHKGQESGNNCSLVYSYLNIHRLTTSEKVFSTAGFFTALFFGCLLAGISIDFFTVAFIRHDLWLTIICRLPCPSKNFSSQGNGINSEVRAALCRSLLTGIFLKDYLAVK